MSARDRDGIEDLKALAYARSDQVLAALGIRERPKRGGYILINSPARTDARPSFVIWIKGGSISFADQATADKGDVFGLIAAVKGWMHLPHGGFLEAKRFLEDALGVSALTPEQKKRDLAQARARAQDDQRRRDVDLEKQRDRAFGLWVRAKPIEGTTAEIYLASRGIGLGALNDLRRAPRILRFLPEHRHHAEGGTETHWPCMIAGCVDPSLGKIRAVHRTWLAASGRGKAPVLPPRKCWPDFAGCVIPLWRGESNLSIAAAAAHGLRETLVIVEGIEDGLSAVLAAPQFRTWAAISLGNIGNITLPDCVDSVIIHRQNDWLKLDAVAAFDRAVAALEAQGRPVSEVRAFAGKDLNDTLRGAK